MQHLHLVGFTAELDGLIFSAKRGSKSGGFVVALDDRLLDSIREAVRLQTGADVDLETDESSDEALPAVAVPELRRLGRVHSVLAPKEIQARLRAGRSVAEVADEAEVDESWILRFASPVLAEQSRIVELALQIRCRANRKGESAEPLAESVAENLIDRGTFLTPDELSGAWSAYHVRDTSWVVRFRYISRRRAQVAQWAYDQSDSTVVPINRLATDLGYLDPARRKRRLPLPEATDSRVLGAADDGVAKAPAAARPTAGRTRVKVAKRAPARKKSSPARAGRAATKRAPAKRVSKSTPVPKPSATKPTTKRVTTKRAATNAPASRATRSRAAGSKATGSKATVSKAPAKPAATRVVTKRTVAKKATKPIPTKKATKPAATRVAAKRTAAKKPAQPAATRVVTKRTAAKKATKPAATSMAAKRTAAKKAAKPAATRVVTKRTVAEKPAKRAVTRAPTSTAAAKPRARKVGPAARRATKKAVAPVAPAVLGSDPAVSPDTGRRPPVSGLSSETTSPAPRRERPLVAVRAAQPAPPLTERIVKVATDHSPLASTGTVVTNGGGGVPLMIAADPAGAVVDADHNALTDADLSKGADRSGSSPTP